MKRIKIFGAGSIGNHHANAARQLGWDVTVCDLDDKALDRMRLSIYPERYGKWDDSIKLFNNSNCPVRKYDLIIVGTPPNSHLKIVHDSILEKPRAILVEKPLCTPFCEDIESISSKLKDNNIAGFIGYDHVVSDSVEKLDEIIMTGILGQIKQIDVEFREHWGGIFAAHPWLEGPQDSYLGYIEKGGGALCEHSHALNLWQHICSISRGGNPKTIKSEFSFVNEDGMNYDSTSLLNIKTDTGLVGSVIQDVVTHPHSKKASIKGSVASLELKFGHEGLGDLLTLFKNGGTEEIMFKKSRPDDFIKELRHISDYIFKPHESPISIEKGIKTMKVIQNAFKSHLN